MVHGSALISDDILLTFEPYVLKLNIPALGFPYIYRNHDNRTPGDHTDPITEYNTVQKVKCSQQDEKRKCKSFHG